MVFKSAEGRYICRACYNNLTGVYNPVIKRCSCIFPRKCDPKAHSNFNNKIDTIIMLTDGICDIKSSNPNGRCLTNETCSDCKTRDNAIIRYKENNFLQ